MTSKTSFFNKGIYLSGIKRFTWGSVLYFIILFMFTVLNCLLTHSPGNAGAYAGGSYYGNPIILSNEYIIIPIFLTVVVPVIVSVMIFKFLHSKTYSVFAHSLPVSKTANFISSVASGLTLMLLPILANGLILMILSVTGYGGLFSLYDCILWIAINAFSVFIIFSCAVFSSVITGNSFAVIVLNAFIHSFLFIITVSFDYMAMGYVYGYSGANEIYEKLMNNNFVCFAFSLSSPNFRGNVTALKIIVFILAAIIIYALSCFLYKKRKNETATDVAGFSCLNAIFKYTATFLATIFTFSVFSLNLYTGSFVFYLILFIVSAVFYFGLEMLLKKSLNVFYAYKGYLVFALAFSVIVFIFAGTSFFGYETRIPDLNDIEAASAYNLNFTNTTPYTDNEEVIKEIISVHSKMVKERKELPDDKWGYADIKIKYSLKNGKEIERRYEIEDEDEFFRIMDKLYSYDKYKMVCEPAFKENKEFGAVYYEPDIYIEERDELLNKLRTDIKNMSYSELYRNNTGDNIHGLRLEFAVREDEYYPHSIYISLDSEYKNTLEWLKEKGYLKHEE